MKLLSLVVHKHLTQDLNNFLNFKIIMKKLLEKLYPKEFLNWLRKQPLETKLNFGTGIIGTPLAGLMVYHLTRAPLSSFMSIAGLGALTCYIIKNYVYSEYQKEQQKRFGKSRPKSFFEMYKIPESSHWRYYL